MATTKVTTDGIDMSDNAGGLIWVKGTTAQQPSGAIGQIRVDTETNRTLVYTDETGTAEWRNLKEEAVTVPPFDVDFLVVAGGAGTGMGGGGAGGFRTSFSNSGGNTSAMSQIALNPGTVYTAIVGTGGTGATSYSVGDATNGNISTLNGSDISLISSTGGGIGGTPFGTTANNEAAKVGGSGGGGAPFGDAPNGASGIAGHGLAGGTSVYTSGSGGAYLGGGGGGSTTAGDNAVLGTLTAGSGGTGQSNSITGAPIPYSGGGGSGTHGDLKLYTPGTGGTGGGGNGAAQPNNGGTAGGNGSVNTGGGGGGHSSCINVGGAVGGSGGSGVVILRMTDADYNASSGVTGSPTVNQNVGGTGNTVIIFNGDGTFTA